MTISSLPLSYCTNVHPGRTVAEVEEGLDRFTLPIKTNYGKDLAAGLWLAASVVHELEQTPDAVARFREGLAARGLSCYTLNAFPYGDFHSARVKENVYLPDWSHADRLNYTLACARCLAALLPEGAEGSISTVPLGFKPFEQPVEFADRCAAQLVELARGLDRLYHETGRVIRLAIEPEPFCVIETTVETIQFFDRLRVHASDANAVNCVRTHIGVCYDVCHQAVEFEDVAASIRSLVQAEIRLNKIHITCAIEVTEPALRVEAMAALARYIEPRYLHQTFAKTAEGKIARYVDLDDHMVSRPADEFRTAPVWRVHFHVPVDAEHLGPLGTTRSELKRALAVIPELDYAPHLEVETYTWEVLPGGGSPNIVEGFSRELLATNALLEQYR
ncbi:metabolite traffic protein EboE [Schlesneria paludicola]|uniref:metabolite traffic protein EboE n=1 Tax=Schlesneria paludicola TaxID=360056 RepID=UPI00029B3019|nr:metabolite traffic protein EboE [Schlesneria paludicola]